MELDALKGFMRGDFKGTAYNARSSIYLYTCKDGGDGAMLMGILAACVMEFSSNCTHCMRFMVVSTATFL